MTGGRPSHTLGRVPILLFVTGIAIAMICVECLFQGRTWPRVHTWWRRALLLNLVQYGIAWIAGQSLERVCSEYRQRPESHCVHHQRNLHAYNYADLPLWDMLFGTFGNPRGWGESCGFEADGEQHLGAMLRGREVA
jgi:sterol desaturase/sphingolipid hydroxylase (fatty acid hydroxylase superfamily)